MQPLCKAYGDSSKKLKIELPYNPATLLLDTYPKELKAVSQREVFTLSIFHNSQEMKINHMPVSTDECIKKCCRYTQGKY